MSILKHIEQRQNAEQLDVKLPKIEIIMCSFYGAEGRYPTFPSCTSIPTGEYALS